MSKTITIRNFLQETGTYTENHTTSQIESVDFNTLTVEGRYLCVNPADCTNTPPDYKDYYLSNYTVAFVTVQVYKSTGYIGTIDNTEYPIGDCIRQTFDTPGGNSFYRSSIDGGLHWTFWQTVQSHNFDENFSVCCVSESTGNDSNDGSEIESAKRTIPSYEFATVQGDYYEFDLDSGSYNESIDALNYRKCSELYYRGIPFQDGDNPSLNIVIRRPNPPKVTFDSLKNLDLRMSGARNAYIHCNSVGVKSLSCSSSPNSDIYFSSCAFPIGRPDNMLPNIDFDSKVRLFFDGGYTYFEFLDDNDTAALHESHPTAIMQVEQGSSIIIKSSGFEASNVPDLYLIKNKQGYTGDPINIIASNETHFRNFISATTKGLYGNFTYNGMPIGVVCNDSKVWNNLTLSGRYCFSTLANQTNAPLATAVLCFLTVESTITSSCVVQTAFIPSTNSTYVRTTIDSGTTWTPWAKTLTTNDLDPATVLTLDTVLTLE